MTINVRGGIQLFCFLVCVPVFAQSVSDTDATPNANEDLRHILEEHSELRSELLSLEQEAQHIKQRLESLDRLAEVQKELDRLTQQLEQAELSDDEERAEQLESKIKPLERQLDQLHEAMKIDENLDERIDELQELIERLKETEGLDKVHQATRYLARTIDSLHKVRVIRVKLNALIEDASESIRGNLEKQADELEQQIDADEEFVELVFRLFEALEDDREEEIEDLWPEINELRNELEDLRGVSMSETTAKPGPTHVEACELASGEYFIMQSWSQEKNFKRPYYVSVPEQNEFKGVVSRKLPVFIFLNGNGGTAKEALIGFRRLRKTIASRLRRVIERAGTSFLNVLRQMIANSSKLSF
ncbi:MAG: hypothetical protein ACKVH8_18420 [Pirellulales bacterium]